MNWQPNTGHRPPGLADKDKIFVRLNNGSEHYWTVQNGAHHKINWRNDPDWPYSIKEWAKA